MYEVIKMAKSTITRNGKTYTKVAKYPYIYRGTDGYYIYRLIHKESGTDTYVTRNNLTKEKFPDVRTALNNQQDRLHSLDNNIPIDYNDFTVAKIWEEMLSKAQKAEGTIRKHSSVYNHHIKPVFEKTKIKDLFVGDINALLEKLYVEGDNTPNHIGGYAYSFVESILKWFYWFYNFSYEQNYIDKATFDKFMDKVKMPPKRKISDDLTLRVLSDDETAKILEILRESDLFLPALISLTTGVRPSECFCLTWDDIDFQTDKLTINKKIVEEKGGLLVIKKPKTTESIRKVDIPAVLKNEFFNRKNLLYKAKIKHPEIFELNRGKIIDDRDLKREIKPMPDFICVDLYGRYIKPSAFNYWAKKIRAEICPHIDGVEDFSFYTFRKTHISKMAAHLTELVLIKHTGHSRIDTIRKYYSGRTDDVEQRIKNTVNIVGSNFGITLEKADRNLFKAPSLRYPDPERDFILENKYSVLADSEIILSDDEIEEIDF